MKAPLGTVALMVENECADVVVVEDLRCGIIIGKDLLRSNHPTC